MDTADHVAAIQRYGQRIEATAAGNLGWAVPSCPGWTLADLVWHVGIVQQFWRLNAVGTIHGPDEWTEPQRPADADLIAWFDNGVSETTSTLSALDPHQPAWSWGRRQNVAFVARRVAQETAVHWWDGQGAVRGDDVLDPSIAADGVDEFVDEVLPALSGDLDGAVQTILLHASDVDRSWRVHAGEGACQVTSQPGPADATVSSTAAGLLLMLWGRRSPTHLDVDDDAAALARFLARKDF